MKYKCYLLVCLLLLGMFVTANPINVSACADCDHQSPQAEVSYDEYQLRIEAAEFFSRLFGIPIDPSDISISSYVSYSFYDEPHFERPDEYDIVFDSVHPVPMSIFCIFGCDWGPSGSGASSRHSHAVIRVRHPSGNWYSSHGSGCTRTNFQTERCWRNNCTNTRVVSWCGNNNILCCMNLKVNWFDIRQGA